MSLGRLLITARDILREGLESWHEPFRPEEIMVMPGPEPPAYSGQHFISLYGKSWATGESNDQNQGIDEVYGFACALTFRSPVCPPDRRGDEMYVKAYIGMEDILRKIIALIHQSIALQVRWDALILAESANFADVSLLDLGTEYPRWSDCDAAPMPVDGTWFSAAPEADAGLVMEARFVRARRMQALDRIE